MQSLEINMQSTPRLAWLDAWRVVAATLVFLTHYKPLDGPLHSLADEGHIGVALFFVLSGAVLGTQLWQEDPSNGLPSSRRWWQHFYVKRLSKIYVLHTLLYAVSFTLIPDDALGIALNFTLTKALVPGYTFSGLAQSWSLTVELMLYLALPILAWARVKAGRGVLFGLMVLALVVSVCSWYGSLYTVLGRSFAFMLGLELAQSWHHRPARPFKPKIWFYALLILVSSMFQLGQLAPDGAHTASTDSTKWYALAANTILIPAAFATLLEITRSEGFLPETSTQNIYAMRLRRWLQSKGLPLLGLMAKASYAFYLLHVGPAAKLVYLVAGYNNVLAFALLWILSIVIYKTIEYPILRIITSKPRFS
jgi:peptidoglycan/LPS O-acetylase OafA/YrhL